MQVIEKFRVASADIKDQLEDYLDDNSGYTIQMMTRLNDAGDESLLVVFDDGQ